MGSDMPAFKNLDEEQRWAVLVYVRSLAFKPTTRPVAAASVTATLSSGVAQVNGGATTTAPPPTQTAGPVSTQPVTGTTTSASVSTPGLNGTPPAAVSGQAAILGKVVNSSNGRLPDGLKAVLQNTDGTKQTEIATSDVQADGSYSFPKVNIVNGQTYLVSVQYNQQTFNSDLIHSSDLPPGGQISTVVNIYDSSTDASVITTDRLHVIMDFSSPGVMQVVELFILSNPTDKVIVSSKPGEPILKFALPLGASALQFQDGDLGARFVQTTDGFGDTQNVLPGSASHQVLFAFNLPYQSGLTLNLPITLPVVNAIVMVPAGRIKLDSKQLKDTGTSSTQGMNLELYSSTKLSPGSILSMTISNAGGSGFLDGGSTSLIVSVIIFLLAVLAGLAFILRLRNNRAAPEMAAPGKPSSSSRSDDTSDSLMDGIIALDDMYQDGELPEEAYLKRRKELKDRLRALSGAEKKP
jgi:hypothetical protein